MNSVKKKKKKKKKNTQYLAIVGELWGIFCDLFWEKIPKDIESVRYQAMGLLMLLTLTLTLVLQKHLFELALQQCGWWKIIKVWTHKVLCASSK